MPFTGYRIYRGPGSICDVDFSTPVATAPASASSVQLDALGHAPSHRYAYAVRAVADDIEEDGVSCWVQFETDAQGLYIGPRPPGVLGLAGQPISNARVRLTWSCLTPAGGPAVAEFAVYHGPSPQMSAAQPALTVPFTRDGEYSCTLALQHGQTRYFRVAARTAGGVESRPARPVGPIVAIGLPPNQGVALTDVVP